MSTSTLTIDLIDCIFTWVIGLVHSDPSGGAVLFHHLGRCVIPQRVDFVFLAPLQRLQFKSCLKELFKKFPPKKDGRKEEFETPETR